jgi:hypothetical protein
VVHKKVLEDTVYDNFLGGLHVIDGDWIRTKMTLQKITVKNGQTYLPLKFIFERLWTFLPCCLGFVGKGNKVSKCKLMYSSIHLMMEEQLHFLRGYTEEFTDVVDKVVLPYDGSELKVVPLSPHWLQSPKMICIVARLKNGDYELPIEKVTLDGRSNQLTYAEDMLIHDKSMRNITNLQAPIYTITYSVNPFSRKVWTSLDLSEYNQMTITFKKSIIFDTLTVLFVNNAAIGSENQQFIPVLLKKG